MASFLKENCLIVSPAPYFPSDTNTEFCSSGTSPECVMSAWSPPEISTETNVVCSVLKRTHKLVCAKLVVVWDGVYPLVCHRFISQ